MNWSWFSILQWTIETSGDSHIRDSHHLCELSPFLLQFRRDLFKIHCTNISLKHKTCFEVLGASVNRKLRTSTLDMAVLNMAVLKLASTLKRSVSNQPWHYILCIGFNIGMYQTEYLFFSEKCMSVVDPILQWKCFWLWFQWLALFSVYIIQEKAIG